MIDTGTAIIAGSFISLFGIIIVIELNNRNWFTRQKWKLDAANTKQINKLNFKKLEREMGLSPSKREASKENTPFAPLSSLAPVLAKLEPEQIMELADRFLPEGAAEGEEPSGITGTLLQYARENPEMVKTIIDKFSGNSGGENINKPAEY